MSLTHAGHHNDNAHELAGQLIDWTERDDIDAASLESLEERLLAHLLPLSSQPVTDVEDQAAEGAEQVWVVLARRHLAARDETEHAALWASAREHLLAGARRAEGAAAFLRRLPAVGDRCADPLDLDRLFVQQPAVRAHILRIWRDRQVEVPLGPLVQAWDELDTDGRRALVDYAAARGDARAEFFRARAMSSGAPVVRAAALAALLVRRAPEAVSLLREACASITDADAGRPLLTLAGLSGEPVFIDTLQGWFTEQPEAVLSPLALLGRHQVAPLLLDALSEPRTAEPAAAAWRGFTGQSLPRIPRLQVVGEEPPDAPLNPRPEERAELMPDAEAARRWWQLHQSGWGAEQRYWGGSPMTASRVARQAVAAAGAGAAQLQTLVEMLLGRPVGVSPYTWVARRRAHYREAGLLNVEQGPPAPAAPKPGRSAARA